ncbi:MAG: SDR family oxidoreductase [Thermoplasmatota archaeon]
MNRITDFREKLILITGGSSGIGLATADKLIKKGSRVVILARDERKLKKASKKLGKKCDHRSVDILNIEDLNRAKEWIIDEHGAPDIIVNSAGFVHPGRLEDLTDEQIDRMIDINLKGTINVCRTFVPEMRSPGHVVNVSSPVGFMGVYGYSVYSASKFGVDGFSESIRMELKRNGIGVSVVYPPDTKTPQLDYENRYKPEETKRITGTIDPVDPEVVADSIIEGIKRNRFHVYPTFSIGLVHFAVRHFPGAVRWWMDRKVV